MLNLKRFMKKSLPAILSFVLVFTLFAPQVGKAADHSANSSLNEMIDKTVEYYKNKKKPLTSWWEIVALWGAGVNLNDGNWQLPSWETQEPTNPVLKPDNGGTEHIRYIFGLLAMGEDPAHAWETDRNLYAELASQQDAATGAIGSTNKHMWAMLALDTGEKLGSNVGKWDAAAKKKAVDFLLSKQLADGGFAYFGTKSDPDMSGMGLLALGNYQNDSAVQEAILRVKAFLQTIKLNQEDVMFSTNSNSIAAVVTGMTAAGEDALSDVWKANDKTVLDSFSLFQLQDGSFKYLLNGGANSMATEQVLIALLDIKYQKTVWHRLEEIKQPISVNMSVDGVTDSVYAKQPVNFTQIKKPTVLDAFKTALDNASPAISYNIVDSSYGPYIKGVAGQDAGTFGGWDGWVYTVNGIAPNVGAGSYKLKANDEVRFFYSRYADITTGTTLVNGASNPSVDVKLVGDEFNSNAAVTDNWKINTEESGLTIQSIVKESDQKIKLNLSGKATEKAVTIQALATALVGKKDSTTITLRVPVTAKLQVDGRSGSIYSKQAVTVKNTVKPVTALDVLKQALNQADPKISYKIEDSSYGQYVSAINGEAAGTFGGYDGWMYQVNGIAPMVGAGEYELKENDEVRFYYSRWPAISSGSKIANGAVDPSIEVKLVGDEFTSQATDIKNWSIDPGNTGLQVNTFTQDGNKITISLTGTATGGAITIKALGAAFVGGQDSEDLISIAVPRVVGDTTDQSFAINKNEKEVVVGAASGGQVTNNVTLTFETTALPKVTATRGTTVLEIPAATVVTTTTWDKALVLPKNLSIDESGLASKLDAVLSADSKKVESIAVRIQVGGSAKIQFNQHVSITLKGQGDKEAGFIDQAGVFTPIKKYADSSVRTDEVYAYKKNNDLVIQTKHFTQFLAYKTAAVTGGGGGTAPIVQKITLSVEKRSLNEGDFVAPLTVTIQDGDTAFSALKRTLEDKGVAIDFSGTGSSIYVKSIGGLAEFDKGKESGWMYSVNGVFPKVSAGAYSLKNGDVVRWQYTKDLGKDLGAPSEPGESGGQVPGENPEPPTAPKYSDESKISSWALEAVNKATALGFMQGTNTSNATFEPKRNLTRAEFAALMVKYSGVDPIMEDSGFKDVSSQAWYYGYVKAAKEKGLMSGVTETSFAPNQPITRQEMAAVLVRLKGLADANAPQAAIKDRDAVAAWAVPYVNVAYQKGLMTGDNGKFNPQALVTREMAAVTIIRLHELKS
ncbi:DUF4430 domain-containing protein [Bacillus sp. FJAT-28004]|uniref:DUF4430 domain-containing protein n=1 Tax=Bacillus sp. FJAT-28004 TaxID=1679165 RepID=UPI0006B5A303|nr:DUF4430 domain-containing protein [Bacillus sp. FJAT-28004]